MHYTIEALFLLIGKSLFGTTRLACGFLDTRKYPHIKRVYVRAEYPHIDDDYTRFLLKSYEQTYYPEKIIGAGKAVYVKRNFEMIDKSEFCVVYYDENYSPTTRKSGTKIAIEYAIKKAKKLLI